MADPTGSGLPSPTPEQRRIAAAQFERANEVLATGNHDYAMQLLGTCCTLDPANLIYRKALRLTQRAKYGNNLRGSRFALLTTSAARLRMKAALRAGDHVKVLEQAELILNRNPWDLGALSAMAEAFDALGLLDQAIWTLEQARPRDAENLKVNRALARLYERHGDFKRAIKVWQRIRKADPADVEAMQKVKDLAASDTIARGGYVEALGSEGATADSTARAAGKSGERTALGEETPTERSAEAESPVPPPPAHLAREAAPLVTRLTANPTSPDGYLQLAALYRRSSQLEAAAEVLTRGLAATANHFELATELADLEIEPFRQNLAVAEARLRDEPQDEELRRIRIRLLKEINTRELYLYRQKAERYPTELPHRLELGLRLLRAGQLDEAIRELQAARADSRHHWRALFYLGYAFKARNNARLAQRNFEDALQALPPDEEDMRKELLFQLATGAAEAGELSRALELAYELANLDFGYKDIGRLLDEWQAQAQGGAGGPDEAGRTDAGPPAAGP
jgi:tetratricopeptide (TPR) repeat protein